MPLIPKSPKSEGPTPAAELHTKYNTIAPGLSRLTDWKDLIKVVGARDASLIVRHVEGTCLHPPKSSTIKADWRRWLDAARADPVASQYPVTVTARELADKIAEAGVDPVDPEWVALAIDNYSAILDKTAAACSLLWTKMVPVTIFVERWYTETCVYGTPRMRALHRGHPKLKQEIHALGRQVGVSYSTVESLLS